MKKALEAGGITGRDTANSSVASGAMLKQESLEGSPKVTTFGGKKGKKKKKTRKTILPIELMKASKYGIGKHTSAVQVHSKSGRSFVRQQMVGSNAKVAGNKEKVANWWHEYKVHNLNKYPIGIPKHKVEIRHASNSKDIHKGAVMTWNHPKTGISQRAYTKEFLDRNAHHKWKRMSTMDSNAVEAIKGKVASVLSDVKSDPQTKQAAAIIGIIAHTGLRIGDRNQFGKVTENRGVSTLNPKNVKVEGDTIKFNFIGKSYKENNSELKDKKLAKYLTQLLQERKGQEFLFEVPKKKIVDTYKGDFGMANNKIKDMRTYVGTEHARKLLFAKPLELPENKSKHKKIIQKHLNDVYEGVSQKLNNTPSMAKKAYIHPAVVDAWLVHNGLNRSFLNKADEEDDTPTLDDIIKMTGNRYGKDVDVDDDEDVDEYNLPEWWDEHLDDYGCLMLKLDVKGWNKFTSMIDKEDVYTDDDGKKGIENEPHVTILYGLHNDADTDDMKKLVNKTKKPITIFADKIGHFENEEYDVVFVEAHSSVLTKLNKQVKESFEHTTKFPEYHPHITIAYVKKGTGKKYDKNIDDMKLEGSQFVYSDKDRDKTMFEKGEQYDLFELRELDLLKGGCYSEQQFTEMIDNDNNNAILFKKIKVDNEGNINNAFVDKELLNEFKQNVSLLRKMRR